ncbi:MAG: VOC family protein [Dehalococcoidia bacterium]
MKNITGVVGVVIWTDNMTEMVSFYRDTLQLPVHSYRPSFVSFEFGIFRLNIGEHSEIKGPAKDPLRVMLHLSVEDIHYWHDRLNSLGVEFIRIPEKESWGGMVATLKDPDGNVLQLLEFPKET